MGAVMHTYFKCFAHFSHPHMVVLFHLLARSDTSQGFLQVVVGFLHRLHIQGGLSTRVIIRRLAHVFHPGFIHLRATFTQFIVMRIRNNVINPFEILLFSRQWRLIIDLCIFQGGQIQRLKLTISAALDYGFTQQCLGRVTYAGC
jgi:hypothetical protein